MTKLEIFAAIATILSFVGSVLFISTKAALKTWRRKPVTGPVCLIAEAVPMRPVEPLGLRGRRDR